MLNAQERQRAIDALGYIIIDPEKFVAERNNAILKNGQGRGDSLLENLNQLIQKENINKENIFDYLNVIDSNVGNQPEYVQGFFAAKKDALQKLLENRKAIKQDKSEIRESETRRQMLLSTKNMLLSVNSSSDTIRNMDAELRRMDQELVTYRKQLEVDTDSFHKNWAALWGARTELEQKEAIDKEAFYEETSQFFADKWKSLKESAIDLTQTTAEITKNTWDRMIRPVNRFALTMKMSTRLNDIRDHKLLANLMTRRMSTDLKNYNEAEKHLRDMQQKIQVKVQARVQSISGFDYIRIGFKKVLTGKDDVELKKQTGYTTHELRILRKAALSVQREKDSLMKSIEYYNRTYADPSKRHIELLQKQYLEKAQKYHMTSEQMTPILAQMNKLQQGMSLSRDLTDWYDKQKTGENITQNNGTSNKIVTKNLDDKQVDQVVEKQEDPKQKLEVEQTIVGQYEPVKKELSDMSIEEKITAVSDHMEQLGNTDISPSDFLYSKEEIQDMVQDITTSEKERMGEYEEQEQEFPLPEDVQQEYPSYTDQEIEAFVQLQQDLDQMEELSQSPEIQQAMQNLRAEEIEKTLIQDQEQCIEIPLVKGAEGVDENRSLDRFLTDEKVEFGVSRADFDCPVASVPVSSIEGVKAAFEKYSYINFGDAGFISYDIENQALCVKSYEEDGMKYCLVPVEECRKAGVAEGIEEALSSLVEERYKEPIEFSEKFLEAEPVGMTVLCSEEFMKSERGQELDNVATDYTQRCKERVQDQEQTNIEFH